jgi:phage host-nuclease inhibitor protein Gam
MAISQNDMTELKRISTNTYDSDKACINRVIRGIGDYEREIRSLKMENDRLTKELAGKKVATKE